MKPGDNPHPQGEIQARLLGCSTMRILGTAASPDVPVIPGLKPALRERKESEQRLFEV